MLCITDEQVKDKMNLSELIDAMSDALVDFSQNRVSQPQRNIVPTPQGGFIALMPAIYPDFMGVKLVTYGPNNSRFGLPTYHATVHLFETATGKPLATLEGGALTDLRTAAVSAVATKLLAVPQPAILAVLGSGAQARSHLEVFMHMHKFAQVRLWSRNSENAKALADELGLKQARSVEEAVAGADVVVATTSAKQAILQGRWLKKGAHVSSVGAFGPENRELDDEVMANIVVVDSREATAKESGDIIGSAAVIYAELGELLSGQKPVPKGQTTVFKSVGMAVEDVAAARLIYATLKTAADANAG